MTEISDASSVDVVDDCTANNLDEAARDIVDKVQNLVLAAAPNQLAKSSISMTAEASLQHNTESTKSGSGSSQDKLSALSTSLSQMFKQAEKAVSKMPLEESYLHVTKEMNKEMFDKALEAEYH